MNGVPRVHRHAVRTLLEAEGLPRLRDWFNAVAPMMGTEGRCEIQLVFDEVQQVMEYEYSEQRVPLVEG